MNPKSIVNFGILYHIYVFINYIYIINHILVIYISSFPKLHLDRCSMPCTSEFASSLFFSFKTMHVQLVYGHLLKLIQPTKTHSKKNKIKKIINALLFQKMKRSKTTRPPQNSNKHILGFQN